MEIDGCPLPEDRRFDLEHDVWWAEDPGAATGRVGLLGILTAFAGPIRSVVLRPVEGRIALGRSVATVESSRLTYPVRLPFDAELVEQNPEVVRNPRLLNDAPYDAGWVVRVRPERPDEPARRLRSAAEVADEVRARIRRQHIRCWPVTPDLELVEVGVECSAVLARLNETLTGVKAGTALLLVTDDPTAPIEMVRWSDQTGHALLAHRSEGSFHRFVVRKEADPHPRRRRAP